MRTHAKTHPDYLLSQSIPFLSVSPCCVALQPSGAAGRQTAMALLTGYEHLLAYLKSHGTLLNAVKPELLLDIADFR